MDKTQYREIFDFLLGYMGMILLLCRRELL